VYDEGSPRWLVGMAAAADCCDVDEQRRSRGDHRQILARLRFPKGHALFLHPLDKGYYKSEGLNVTINPASNSIEPIERVASGDYDIGFGDINTLIKHRDAKPGAPVKAVFMLYNRPPFAVIGRKSRGIVAPKDLKERHSAHQHPTVLRAVPISCRRTASIRQK
jgi:NitT/TauT family transport system substrate-binding protein